MSTTIELREAFMNHLTKSQARELVVQCLAAVPDHENIGGFVILDEHTIERPWGWVFFYDSCKHHETRDSQYALAGNAPYFVNRFDGSMHVAGTANTPEHYIAEYESQIANGFANPSPHPRGA